jgi:predicted dehydrogenase
MDQRIAVVGLGSIGSKHVNTLLGMGHTDLVGVDSQPMPHEDRLPVVEKLRELDRWGLTHALICSPPREHYVHAKWFVDQGIPTFIEKPMTMTPTEARTLCAIAHMSRSVLAVGYMERAHPVVNRFYDLRKRIKILQIECLWKGEKKTYPLDVIAESSHALDLALWMLGPAETVWRSKTAETATVRMKHAGRAFSTVAMSMVADIPHRKLSAELTEGNRLSERYGLTKLEWDDCYRAELQAFLDGVPLCTGFGGAAVVELIERLK